MINTNEKQQDVSLALPYRSEIQSGRQLLVLLSSADVDLVSVTSRIWKLAQTSGSHIQLIGLCRNITQEPSLKRVLVSMAAMLNYGNVTADTRILTDKDWLTVLKPQLHSSDMLVCWDEPHTGLFEKPLGQLIRSHLNVPLYILSPAQQTDSRSNLLISALTWTGFIAITIGFLLLQVKILQQANEWAISLEILTTAVELWLIWVWNRLFS